MPASKALLDAATGPFVGKDELNDLHAIIDYAGTPSGNVTPTHIGQLLHDTSNDNLYWAYGLANTEWKSLSS